MKELLAKATLKTPINSLNDAKDQVNKIILKKDRTIQDYAIRHNLLNIGVEMNKEGNTFVFIFSALTPSKLSDKDKRDFIKILTPEFKILDDGSEEVETLKMLGVSESDLPNFYEDNYRTFADLEYFYSKNNITSKYLQNIEEEI